MVPTGPRCSGLTPSVHSHSNLHWCQLDGGDVGGVHHGFGPVGGVRQEALPLLRQPGELLLPRVEARVDPVLKVRRGGDLQPFLLLPKHAGTPWHTWSEAQRDRFMFPLSNAFNISPRTERCDATSGGGDADECVINIKTRALFF